MNKYFVKRNSLVSTSGISSTQIAEYKKNLMFEMEKNGATQNELALVGDEIVLNSIRNKRQPEDVAWAILQ